jgi:hypothetical protein
MDIVKDSRLISLDTNYATKLNGDYNSNLFFDLPHIVEENTNITHIEVSLEDATIPVSWYLINDETNTLNFTYNSQSLSLILKHGNYTSTALLDTLTNEFLIKGLTATCSLDKQSGKTLFIFSNPITDITFLHSGSEGLFRLLGFLVGTNYIGTTIISPTPMNLLGIQKLNLSSQSLATISSFSSSPLLSNCLIQTIPVDQPAWNQITYINRGTHFGRMKARYLKNIDIQLQDEFGRFLEMNNTNFTLTIQLIIFRKMNISIENIFLPRLLEKIKEEDAKRQEQKKEPPKDDELELLST